MNTPPTVYFLYGDHDLVFKDFVSRLKEKMGEPENAEMNIERFTPTELDLSKLEQICSTVPFIAPRRVVIVEQPSRIMSSDDDKERFFELLSSIPEIEQVTEQSGYLLVNFTDGQTASVVARTLVKGDVDILSIEPERMKLDDAFLELTKGMVH